MPREIKDYPKICANPECVKDFVAKYKEATFCSRLCARKYGNTNIKTAYGVDFFPVTEEGFFDADAFCGYFYPKDKVERSMRPIGGEIALRTTFTNN
jgi:hypothetical protein